MKKRLFLSILLFTLILSADLSSQRIAVMEIVPDESARGTFSDKQLHAATQYLYAKLAGKFNLINQTQLKEIYAEMIEEGRIASRKQCIDDSCRIELGKSASANYNLNSRISQFAGNCTLTVEMINLRTTMVEQGNAASADFKCDIKGLSGAIIKVASLLTGETVETVYAPAASVETSSMQQHSRRGRISVETDPSGVEVLIDGRRAGRTPFAKEVSAGKHMVKVATRCFDEEAEDVSVDEDDEEDVSFDLEPRDADLKVVLLDGYGQVIEGEVEVDGESVGDFPGVVTLPICTQKVRLITDENDAFVFPVRLSEHRVTLLKKQLKKSGVSPSSSQEKQQEDSVVETEKKETKDRPVLRTYQGFDIGYGTTGVNGVGFGYHFEFSLLSFFGWDLHSTMIYAPDTEYFDVQFSTGPKLFFAFGRFVPFISIGGNFIYAIGIISSEYGGGFYIKSGFDIATRGKFSIGVSAEYAMNFGVTDANRFVLLLRLNY